MSAHDPITDTQLRALLAGSLAESEVARLEARLEADPHVQARLDLLSGASEFRAEFDPRAAPSPPSEDDDLSGVIDSLKAEPASRAPSPTPSLIASILAPPHEPGSIGSLGAYEIEGHLATGGMGVVYKARDPRLKRQVAIKVLSPQFAGHDEAMQRFLREATAAAAIEHPHVLPIHAIDTESAELPFIVMRYVDGPSVEKLISERRGPLEFEQVLAIAKAVSSALAAAHAKDLTHRDIKPSNILIETDHGAAGTDSQSIYLTDFGLAHIADETSLTRPGTFLGTPQFSSPEQARGEAAGPLSDLFSLGTVLYTMATGASPFSGEDNSLTSVIYRVVHQPHPPAQSVNPALPSWFAQLTDRLLEKDPANRPPSAAAVLRCLEAESPAALDSRPTRTPARQVLVVALLLIALLAVSLIFLNPLRSNSAEEAGGSPAPPPEAPAPAAVEIAILRGDEIDTRSRSLAEAIASARDGDTIEVRHDGRLATGPLVIPPGKALTLRAGDGTHPRLHLGSASGPLLTAQAPVVLEGFTLSAARDNALTSPPLIRIDAERFAAVGCRFELPTDVQPRRRVFVAYPPVIEVAGVSRCTILNCELVAAGSGGIRILEPAESPSSAVRIANSFLVANSGLELHRGAPGDGALEVTLDRNLICCRSALVLFGAGEAFPVTMHVSDNLFTSDTAVIDTPLRMRDLFDNVSWKDRNNVYSTQGYLARAGERSSRPALHGLSTMLQFKTLLGTDIEGSIRHDLNYRTHIGRYLLEPATISAQILNEVPEPSDPLPTTGPVIDDIGPGEPYHRWKQSDRASSWP